MCPRVSKWVFFVFLLMSLSLLTQFLPEHSIHYTYLAHAMEYSGERGDFAETVCASICVFLWLQGAITVTNEMS